MENTPKNNTDLKKQKEEVLVFHAYFENQKVIIKDSAALSEFYERSYIGTKLDSNFLQLEIEEALLLLERDRIILFDNISEKMSIEQLLGNVDDASKKIWLKFLVYRDLRQRGYVVRRSTGDDIDFRLFPRGASRKENIAKHLIYILNEADPIRLPKLDRITSQAVTARKNLLLAVVDRLGEPTYYSLEQFNLTLNEKKDQLW